FFQAEDGIRDGHVTGVQTCALPICYEELATAGAKFRFQLRDETTCVRREDFRITGVHWPGDFEAANNRMLHGISDGGYGVVTCRSEERRVGKECRSRGAAYH